MRFYKWCFVWWCDDKLLNDKKMSGLGTKTPVSCLQEYLVSKQNVPEYKLIHDGVGTHNPEFTFRVQVGALQEEGTGRSKQEAKHRAAEKMLRTLKVIDKKEDKEEEETNEFNKEPAENHVGQLKYLCKNIHYPDPKYYLEEAAGPAHSRVFKMICCVSQLKDFGISKTKKQAKQQAAAKMLERLKEVGGKKIKDFLTNLDASDKVVLPSEEEINDKYNTLKSTNVANSRDPVALYKDNHNAYIGLQETSPTLSKVLKVTNVECCLGLLQEIVKELGVELSTVKISGKENNIIFTVMTMSVCPPIGGVGLDEKQAASNLLNSLLDLCKE